MEIRIRNAYETEAQPLGEVPFDKASLEHVIPLLNRWGVVDDEGNTYENVWPVHGNSAGRVLRGRSG